MRLIRNSAAFAANKDPAVAAALRVPAAEIYAIDVSFPALKDKAELDYLNQQPTTSCWTPKPSIACAPRAAPIIMDSPEFKRLLKDVGATIVAAPPTLLLRRQRTNSRGSVTALRQLAQLPLSADQRSSAKGRSPRVLRRK